MIYDVIIIGAGASGLYLAAHLYGKKVLVIEKNTRVGLKLLASGNGQCNLTHTGKVYEIVQHYGDKKKFVKPAISVHDNEAVRAYFSLKEVPTYAREDGKIFPKSMRSKDVLKALTGELEKLGIPIITGSHVLDCTQNSSGYTVFTKEKQFLTKNLVIATGGITYPQLGASDMGYVLAEKMGHKVVEPRPALAAVYTRHEGIKSLQGLVLENACVTLERTKKVYQGSLLFTHFGLSGPLIIDHSRDMLPKDLIKINWLKDTKEKIEQTFLKTVDEKGHLPLNYYMNLLDLHEKVKTFVLVEASLNGNKKLSEVTKSERKILTETLCETSIGIDRLSGLNEAMATAGGVDTSEIDPRTMASKYQEGLYFIGEVLDVDGDTGGYNLQWAFSSAYAVAQRLMR